MNYSEDFRKFFKSMSTMSGHRVDQMVDASLTPYILEERQMRATQLDIFSRLMMDRIIWIAGAIDDNVSTVVQAQLLYLENVDRTADVTMHLDTPGGSVKSGLSVVDMMEYVNYDVKTINTGMCASMGSVLLGAGTPGKRGSLNYSKVMIHQVSHGSQGNIQDTRINQKEAEKYNFILFKKLGQYMNMGWKEVIDLAKHDVWLDSSESLEIGIIDTVVSRSGKNMSDMMTGFDEYRKIMDV